MLGFLTGLYPIGFEGRIHYSAARGAVPDQDFVAEIALPGSRGALQPDLGAMHAASAVVVSVDASLKRTFEQRVMHDAAVAPLRPMTARGREDAKVAKYHPTLVGWGINHTCTPFTLKVYGRTGPATRRWQRDALGRSVRAGARATLLR